MRQKSAFLFLILGIVVLVSPISGNGAEKKKPSTIAELALYKGADRQQLLEEGAKKEGKLTIYTSSSNIQYIAKAFEKKYPFIKVEVWRGSSNQVLPKVFEEFRARRNLSDIIAITQDGTLLLEESGLLQPFSSPEQVHYREDAVRKAPGGGAFAIGHYMNGRGIGFNKKLIARDKLPKTYRDLLDPKWKGKMPIVGSESGVGWMGAILETHGEDFVKQLAKQDFQVHMVSARALLDMIANGEYLFSPTIADSHVDLNQRKGGPLDWIPLEPVHSFLGQITLPKHANHPHAAILYIDFDLSKENAKMFDHEGYFSPRKDIPLTRDYKAYFGPFSTKQAKRWDDLFKALFLKR